MTNEIGRTNRRTRVLRPRVALLVGLACWLGAGPSAAQDANEIPGGTPPETRPKRVITFPATSAGTGSEWDDGGELLDPLPPVAAAPPAELERSQEYSVELESFVEEFLETRDEIAGRPGGDDPIPMIGPDGRANWFDALVVTHRENPLLEEGCKKEALQLSLDTLRAKKELESNREAIEMAAQHMHDQLDFVRSHGISYAGYLEHVAECRAFCAPLVAELVECQVLAVARSPHGIVLFELDSDEVAPAYDDGMLARVAERVAESPSARVALIGRASRIGDLRYNRRLSARRSLAVRDRLMATGVPAERIKTMWFGWEPPQIDASIADEYGLGEIYDVEGEERLNQSVLAVLYEASDGS